MDQVEKYRVLAVLVRGIFEGFTAGVVDCHEKQQDEKLRPQNIKRLMVERYEKIADVFHSLIFFPLAVLNFTNGEAEKIVREAERERWTMGQLIKAICATEEMYNAMVEEYKRNFTLLLDGKYLAVQDLWKNYTRQSGKAESVDNDISIRLVVRAVMTAYARGIRSGGTGKVTLHQPTLYRLLIESMMCLFETRLMPMATLNRGVSVMALLLRACKTQDNVDTLLHEMERTYQELVKDEGIIARDDTAN